MNFNEALGANIKAQRKLAKVPQDEFAFSLSLTRASIANIEAGRQAINCETLVKICQILKCQVTKLLPFAHFEFPDVEIFRQEKVNVKIKKHEDFISLLKSNIIN